MLTFLFTIFGSLLVFCAIGVLYAPELFERPPLERWAPSPRWRAFARLAVFGAVVAVILHAGGAVAADVDVAPATPDVAKQLVLHAAGIAVFIRAVIALLKSPVLGVMWGKVPEPARVAVLVVLGAVAVAFDNLALGTPLADAFLGAFMGLFGVVGGHEMTKRVLPRKDAAR